MVQISPIIDEPILVIENKTRSFIAADLHIGIEYELDQHGITIPSQTEKILKKITKHLKKVKPDQIILLGDVKHKIPYTTRQEERELPEFITELAAHAEIYILPGNHDIKIEKLISRIKNENISEVIIATSSNAKGEATAIFIFDLLKNMNIKITRIARGVPIGVELEYIDKATLAKAIEGRREF